ncbi:type II secretion system protein [Vibrio metoecus]|uniref:PilW family protein n=1 Tax=Vibrio metoecus TaxID=1481663 RepID=UPI00300D01F6
MSRGFTLIEMVITIILLGIVGLFLGNILGQAMGIYADTSAREALIQQGRFITERMSRELREAVPNSVMVANGCIEFLPIVNSAIYQSFPTTSINQFRVLPVNKQINAGERLVISPLSAQDLREELLPAAGQIAEVASAVDFSEPLKMVDVPLVQSTLFTRQSPANRAYFYQSPIAYCYEEGSRIYRYANYALNRTLLAPAYLGNERVLMAENLSAANFAVLPAQLQRNGLIKIELTFAAQGETVRFDHDALVYNTP